MISTGNIEHSTGKRLILIIRPETFFFRRPNNNAKSEELIDKI